MYSGSEALEYLESLPKEKMPHLILLDVLMPGMNGCEVLQAIRTQAATQGIPVILLSVLSQDEITERLACSCTGYNGYINKPFDMKRVMQAVAGVVHG